MPSREVSRSPSVPPVKSETEAEGVAYVVAEALGIHSETDAYSFGYIATWGKDDTKKLVKESLGRIQKCANEIIGQIEAGFEI